MGVLLDPRPRPFLTLHLPSCHLALPAPRSKQIPQPALSSRLLPPLQATSLAHATASAPQAFAHASPATSPAPWLAPHASLHGSVPAASPAKPWQTCVVRPDPDSSIPSLVSSSSTARLSMPCRLWTVNPIGTGRASIVAVCLELVAAARQAVVGRMRKGTDEHPSLHTPS